MDSYPRVIHQPPGGRPRWINEGGPANELQYLGWGWRAYGRHPIPVSLHAGWTYQMVASGRAVLDTGEKRVPVAERQLAIIGPSCPNGWAADRLSDRCRIFTWIWRDPPLMEAMRPPPDGWRVFVLAKDDVKRFEALHAETRSEITRLDDATAAAMHAIRSRIDVLIARSGSRIPAQTGAQTRMEYALNWLGKHPEELRPVAALADYLQVSPATLNRLFRSQVGKSVREIAYAMRMGYVHANDFTRAYTRFWREGPSGRPASGKRAKARKPG